MTSAVVLQRSGALPTRLRDPRRVQPRGFDRLVVRVSVAMLQWARRRADRSFVPYEEPVLRNHTALETERRERSDLPIALRLL